MFCIRTRCGWNLFVSMLLDLLKILNASIITLEIVFWLLLCHFHRLRSHIDLMDLLLTGRNRIFHFVAGLFSTWGQVLHGRAELLVDSLHKVAGYENHLAKCWLRRVACLRRWKHNLVLEVECHSLICINSDVSNIYNLINVIQFKKEKLITFTAPIFGCNGWKCPELNFHVLFI